MFCNRNIIVLLLLFFFTSNFAGNNDSIKKKNVDGRYFGIFYHQHAISSLQPAGWKSFASSYNSVAKPIEELGNFRNKNSYDFGIIKGSNLFDLVITYQRIFKTCGAKLLFNEERIFEFRNNTLCIGLIRKAINIKQRYFVGLSTGFRIGGAKILTARYKYRDGFESYGSDLPLNGVYNGFMTLGGEFGVNMCYKIKCFIIQSNFIYEINNFVSPSDYSDLAYFKSINIGNTLAGPLFPSDYNAYLAGSVSYSTIKAKLNGYKLTFGISYVFSK